MRTFIILLFLIPSVSLANNFSTSGDAARFNRLIEEYRCLVCQNQSLAESEAPLARDLRTKIAVMINEKRSDEFITQYLVQRYGEFILYKPPLKRLTYVLWYGPFIFLGVGFLFYGLAVRRGRRNAALQNAEWHN